MLCILLGGSSHLVSRLVQLRYFSGLTLLIPQNPTYTYTYIYIYITYLGFVGSSPPSMIYTNRPMFLAFRHAYSHGDTYSPRPMKNWYWSYWAGNDGALCWKILKSAAENKEPYHFAGYPIRVRYLSVSHYPNVILQDIFMWSIGIYIYI